MPSSVVGPYPSRRKHSRAVASSFSRVSAWRSARLNRAFGMLRSWKGPSIAPRLARISKTVSIQMPMVSENRRNRNSRGISDERTQYEVLVIGGGASGIGAAIRLRQEGIFDFAVLEKSDALGGTWRDNTYPG